MSRFSSAPLIVGALALLVGVAPPWRPAAAQSPATDATLAGANAHARKMLRLFPDRVPGAQATPPVIPRFEVHSDPSGAVATLHPSGATRTAANAFFADLGSNGRTCFTCHQGRDGWTISAEHVRARFAADENDPLFRRVDGATCPSDDVSTPAARRNAYRLLLDKGLIRIGLPMPAGSQFEVLSVDDPYGCNTDPTTGLTSPSAGTVSVYRRPLPSTNLAFLTTIMWDGREPDLFSQAVDATLGHAQGQVAPTAVQQQQIVSFEGCTRADTPAACASTPRGAGSFTAQIFDLQARDLDDDGARGGPIRLPREAAKFFIGINDPLGGNPTGAPFTSDVFNLFDAWDGLAGHSRTGAARLAIARGEQVFDTVQFNITGVGGLNDVPGRSTIRGTCSTCHDTPAVGNHSVKLPLDIGVADAGANAPPALDTADLPVFSLWCTAGPLAGRIFEVTDPARATITGQCADIGKVKGPILRGLAARAPYFHNGSAASLREVVEFYDQRFQIGLTGQQKADLAAFLNSL